MPWYAKESGVWNEVFDPYRKSGTSWQNIDEGYARQAGVWKRFYKRDSAPPISPVLTVEETSTGFVIAVDDPFIGGNASNEAYVTVTGASVQAPLIPGQVVSIVKQNFDSSVGFTYTWDVEIIHNSVYSFKATFYTASGIASATTTTTYYVPPATNYYQRYFKANLSDSWKNGEGWVPESSDIIQGGNTLHRGCWFYDDNLVPFWGKSVTFMQIQVSRRNTNHGVAGKANVHLVHHSYRSKPNDAPEVFDQVKIGELGRGEMKWFTVPQDWYRGFKNANTNFRGFGLFTSDSGTSSPNYLIGHGVSDGVGNGNIYCEYHD